MSDRTNMDDNDGDTERRGIGDSWRVEPIECTCSHDDDCQCACGNCCERCRYPSMRF